ncbi:hypothetical protein DRQ18_06355 [bacterium]|nr:MAG: hypothetical protein DRQ18_06355 [bacterium]
MLCTDATEQECLTRGLFGEREWCLGMMTPIKKGDIGFLLNVSRDELIGIFVAESEARLNIVPEAWGGNFPAQIKVRQIGVLQRVENATEKLEAFLKMKTIHRTPKSYRIPVQKAYGPEITQKILQFFNTKGLEKDLLQKEQQEEEEMPLAYEMLDNVAGLEEVKEFIRKRIIAPFEDEELAYKLKLRIGGGILLFGPPGNGKTLIARAIAHEMQAKFVDISPSIIAGFPGEAEKHLEKLFESLKLEPRAVVFIDEAEWILGRREEEKSTVMQRVKPALLALLSRIFKERRKPILVIAATNKPHLIDSAFLRPGRFDKLFYVGLPDLKARKKLLEIFLSGRAHNLIEQDFDFLAKELDGYSGADIAYIIDEAAYLAFERRKTGKEQKITRDDILKVIKQTRKSVLPEEIKEIEEWAKQQGVIR